MTINCGNKLCWTCRNEIDVMASRCPFCTTAVDHSGFQQGLFNSGYHSGYRQPTIGRPTQSGTIESIIVLAVFFTGVYYGAQWLWARLFS